MDHGPETTAALLAEHARLAEELRRVDRWYAEVSAAQVDADHGSGSYLDDPLFEERFRSVDLAEARLLQRLTEVAGALGTVGHAAPVPGPRLHSPHGAMFGFRRSWHRGTGGASTGSVR